MKNKTKPIVLSILIATIIAVGITYIFKSKITSGFIPDIEQSGPIFIKIIKDTAYVKSKLLLKNNTLLNIKIDSVHYKISIYNKTHLQNEQFLGIDLPPHGEDSIDLSIKVPYLTILNDFKNERKKSDSLTYSINVFLKYSTVFGKKEKLVNKQIKIKIPHPPEFIVEDIKYKKVHLKNILAVARIKIINPNNIKLSIKEIHYSINILKQGNVKGSFDNRITIMPSGSTYIDLPFEININNFGRTLFEILINKDNYDYTLTLNAILKTDKTKEFIHLDIMKTGKMELKK